MKKLFLLFIAGFVSFSQVNATEDSPGSGSINSLNEELAVPEHNLRCCKTCPSGSTGRTGARGFPGPTGPVGPRGATGGAGIFTDVFASVRSTAFTQISTGVPIVFPAPITTNLSGVTYDALTGLFTVPSSGSYQISFGFVSANTTSVFPSIVGVLVDGVLLPGSSIGASSQNEAEITLIAEVTSTISLVGGNFASIGSFFIVEQPLVSIFIEIVRLDD